MKELFDGKKWPLVRMKDVCIINPSKKEISHLDENSEVSFLPMASISEDGIIISKQAKLLKNANKGFTYFREGDVLIAKITPCFENGKRALAKELKHQIGFGTTEFHVLRSGEKVLPEWIFYVISSSRFRKKESKAWLGVLVKKSSDKVYRRL